MRRALTAVVASLVVAGGQVDGVVGKPAGDPHVAAVSSAPVARRLSIGDTGSDVRDVQAKLASYGYTIAVDGVFGSQTDRVVRAWQRVNGLVIDGIVGPQTLATLTPTITIAGGAEPGSSTPPAPQSIEQIIRAAWPDDLEEKALAIAWRESRHQPHVTSSTGCCHGLFQIYWGVHRGWLDDVGVHSAQDLFDPVLNARAAYRLYQRAGGWDPWKL